MTAPDGISTRGGGSWQRRGAGGQSQGDGGARRTWITDVTNHARWSSAVSGAARSTRPSAPPLFAPADSPSRSSPTSGRRHHHRRSPPSSSSPVLSPVASPHASDDGGQLSSAACYSAPHGPLATPPTNKAWLVSPPHSGSGGPATRAHLLTASQASPELRSRLEMVSGLVSDVTICKLVRRWSRPQPEQSAPPQRQSRKRLTKEQRHQRRRMRILMQQREAESRARQREATEAEAEAAWQTQLALAEAAAAEARRLRVQGEAEAARAEHAAAEERARRGEARAVASLFRGRVD
jgi:hypothetical protein